MIDLCMQDHHFQEHGLGFRAAGQPLGFWCSDDQTVFQQKAAYDFPCVVLWVFPSIMPVKLYHGRFYLREPSRQSVQKPADICML